MQIDRILYPINTLGPGTRIGIWTVGCPHHCVGCSNPELWETDESKNIDIQFIIDNIEKQKNKIDGVTITGGEPFVQKDELSKLLIGIHQLGIYDVLVYTGYTYVYLEKFAIDILKDVDVLIDGKYIRELNDNQGIRGSSNQRMHILNQKLSTKYEGYMKVKRERQNFVFKDKIISIGIPNKV